jgi:hypothetical protein
MALPALLLRPFRARADIPPSSSNPRPLDGGG